MVGVDESWAPCRPSWNRSPALDQVPGLMTLSPLCVVQVTNYLTKKFAELCSPNKFRVYMGHGGKPWVSDFNHPHYMAGRKALKTGSRPPWGWVPGPLACLPGLCLVVRACGYGVTLRAESACRLGGTPSRPRRWSSPGLQGGGSATEPSLAAQGSPLLLLRFRPSVWCGAGLNQGRWQYSCDSDLSGGHRQECHAVACGVS